jgi:hypothetical protein
MKLFLPAVTHAEAKRFHQKPFAQPVRMYSPGPPDGRGDIPSGELAEVWMLELPEQAAVEHESAPLRGSRTFDVTPELIERFGGLRFAGATAGRFLG